jgi:hypothetical protein
MDVDTVLRAMSRAAASEGSAKAASGVASVLPPGGTQLNHRNVPQKFSGTLEKIDPVKSLLQSKRKVPAEGVRRFPGRASPSPTSPTSGAALAATRASVGTSGSGEESPALRRSSGGLSDEAKGSMNELQLLVDLMGPYALPDDEVAELMRSTGALAAGSDSAGFLRLDQSKLPLEMFDDDVRVRITSRRHVTLHCTALHHIAAPPLHRMALRRVTSHRHTTSHPPLRITPHRIASYYLASHHASHRITSQLLCAIVPASSHVVVMR